MNNITYHFFYNADAITKIVKDYYINNKNMIITNLYFSKDTISLEFQKDTSLYFTLAMVVKKEYILNIVQDYVEERFKQNLLHNLNLKYVLEKNDTYIYVSYEEYIIL